VEIPVGYERQASYDNYVRCDANDIITERRHQYTGSPKNTEETATYGSEIVADRIAVDQIVDLRHMLRYLGIPLTGPSWLFRDNLSTRMINSSTVPGGKLDKLTIKVISLEETLSPEFGIDRIYQNGRSATRLAQRVLS
jgi:hypothetical protein